MQIGDYSAHIIIDGQESEEFGVQFETPTRVTCWIASEEGKKFGIEWCCNAETRTKGNVGWVRVDDFFCGGSPMYPGPLGDGDTGELSDDDSLLHKEVPQGFGEIQLEIEHGKLTEGRRVRHTDVGAPNCDDKFHEASKKAAHHRIRFGPKKARKDRPSKYVSYLEVDDEPSLFFVFKYRPIALLRAHDLVPVPVSDRSQSNDMQKAELRKEIQDTKDRLKRLLDMEMKLSEEPRSKRVKYEDSGPDPQSHPVSVVIDLTND